MDSEYKKKSKKNKSTFFEKVFSIIIQYKDTAIFKWVYNHPGIAMSIVALWGIVIIGMFMWFVISIAAR